MPWTTWKRLVHKNKHMEKISRETLDYYRLLWSPVIGRVRFWAVYSASPTSLKKKNWLRTSPSSTTVHGGQHDAKDVTFELPLHAAFVADEIWGRKA